MTLQMVRRIHTAIVIRTHVALYLHIHTGTRIRLVITEVMQDAAPRPKVPQPP